MIKLNIIEFSIRKFICFIFGHKTEYIETSNPNCEIYICKRCGECFDCD